MRATGNRIDSLPHVYCFYQQWDDDVTDLIKKFAYCKEKLVLVGHSFGAATSIEAAAQIAPYPIEHLILLDPVAKKHWYSPLSRKMSVSDNVKQATCFRRKPLIPPWPLPIQDGHHRENVVKHGFDHNEFCRDPEIADFIYGAVLAAI